MDQHILISTRDTLLFAVPFFFMLLITLFRLDQIIAAPKGSFTQQRPRCGVDPTGEPILCDPDGRLSGIRPRRRIRKKTPGNETP